MADLAAPAGTQVDGFVSYSRRDAAVVMPLVGLVEQRGRALWVDADDIPAGAPWRDELGNGIEAADTFVGCLSDQWLASTECRKEFDQAVALGKRLVPVLVGPLDERAVPPQLAVLQWVRARDLDPDESVLQILAAIDVDHERVREHTYWLVRALRWDRQEQDRSLLVRGQELRNAEDWLGRPGANPAPTPLQSRFVTASRRAERSRLRTLLAVAVAAVLVTGVLAVVAVVQRGEAVTQRKEADAQRAEAIRQRDVARSRQLATVALDQIDVDSERAVLLAREAWRVSPTDEALAALRSTVNASYARVTVPAHQATVSGVGWTSARPGIVSVGLDGVLAVTGDDGSSLATTTLPQRKLDHLVSTPDGNSGLVLARDGSVERWSIGSDGSLQHAGLQSRGVVAIAASAEGNALVAARGDGSALLVRPEGARRIRIAPTSGVTAVAVARNGGIIAAGTDRGAVYVVRNRGTPFEFDPFDSRVENLAFSGAGRLLLAGSQTGKTDVLDMHFGISLWKPGDGVFASAISPDGLRVVTGDVDGVVLLKGSDVSDVQLSDGGFLVDHLVFSSDGSMVAGAAVNGPARVWRVSDGSLVASLVSSSGNGAEVAFAPDGRRVATGHPDGDVRIWDLPAQPTPIEPADARLRIGKTDKVALSPDGSRLAVARTFVDFFVLPSGEERDPTSCPAPPVGPGCLAGSIFDELKARARAVAIDERATRVAVGTDGGDVGVWDLASGQLLARAPATGLNIDDLAFGPDGTWVVADSPDGVTVLDSASGDVLAQPDTGSSANTVVVLPDGTIVYADETGMVWAAYADSRPPKRLADLGSSPFESAVSPDGSRIAFGLEGEVKVLDPDGATVASLPTGSGFVSAVAYTSDGGFLMAGGDDGTVHVWDATTDGLAFRLAGPGGSLDTMAVASGGNDIVVGGLAGTFELTCEVCVDAADLVALAGRSVTRELTAQERRRYLRD